ncbi:MAG TPA: hypothetical protein VHF51_14085 [Solirubrobacteraceae bacterium]|nr:hypothetical protein [Solirubrobacteraceae bacterium]
MTDRSSTTTAIVPSPSPLAAGRHPADESSLSRSARSLGDAARAFRETSGAQHDPEDLTRAFALIEAALDDLAAGAELLAYATMEGSSRRRAGATVGLPLATARALSWRLHGLRRGLVAVRRICSELTRVLDGAVRR